MGGVMSGWLKFHRSTLEWEWYHHLPTRVLFMHLLLIVNREPSTFQGEPIPVGGKAVGRKQLAEETGLTEQQVRTALINLKSTNEITIKSTKKFSVVTLVNWATYQEGKTKQPSNQPSEQPQINRKSTTEEEVINNKLLVSGITRELWNAFKQHRNKIRKPMTDLAEQQVLKKLIKLKEQGFSPHERLLEAIEKGWQTVYEPRKNNETNTPNHRRHGRKSISERADDAMHEVLAEYGITAGNVPNNSDSSAVFRHSEHLWENPRAIEKPYAGDD